MTWATLGSYFLFLQEQIKDIIIIIGVWDGDYGWGVRVRRHLAHAGGVLYGMELGSVTLKINNQHTPASGPGGTYRRGAICAGVWETPCDRSTLPSVYFG